MRVFVDTSALFAYLDRDDANHDAARSIWTRLIAEMHNLTGSNYILLETAALVQRRLGTGAVNEFHDLLAPVLQIEWVDEEVHREGVVALLAANRRDLSLVDCVSFSVCRRAGVDQVFAFDEHFAEQGFALLRA